MITFILLTFLGYGYSKMSKEEQIKVGKFIEDYLENCNNISLIVLLLDIRHKPTNDDVLMFDYIKKTNLPFIIITNKADKIAKTKVDVAVSEIKSYLGISFSTILPFSSERKIYSEKVIEELEKFI